MKQQNGAGCGRPEGITTPNLARQSQMAPRGESGNKVQTLKKNSKLDETIAPLNELT